MIDSQRRRIGRLKAVLRPHHRLAYSRTRRQRRRGSAGIATLRGLTEQAGVLIPQGLNAERGAHVRRWHMWRDGTPRPGFLPMTREVKVRGTERGSRVNTPQRAEEQSPDCVSWFLGDGIASRSLFPRGLTLAS
jgi:hypothetical protein